MSLFFSCRPFFSVRVSDTCLSRFDFGIDATNSPPTPPSTPTNPPAQKKTPPQSIVWERGSFFAVVRFCQRRRCRTNRAPAGWTDRFVHKVVHIIPNYLYKLHSLEQI